MYVATGDLARRLQHIDNDTPHRNGSPRGLHTSDADADADDDADADEDADSAADDSAAESGTDAAAVVLRRGGHGNCV